MSHGPLKKNNSYREAHIEIKQSLIFCEINHYEIGCELVINKFFAGRTVIDLL